MDSPPVGLVAARVISTVARPSSCGRLLYSAGTSNGNFSTISDSKSPILARVCDNRGATLSTSFASAATLSLLRSSVSSSNKVLACASLPAGTPASMSFALLVAIFKALFVPRLMGAHLALPGTRREEVRASKDSCASLIGLFSIGKERRRSAPGLVTALPLGKASAVGSQHVEIAAAAMKPEQALRKALREHPFACLSRACSKERFNETKDCWDDADVLKTLLESVCLLLFCRRSCCPRKVFLCKPQTATC
mmetsp:Transcript_35537/g.57515  ORF Transcript_35537/g.57515 Transcript_35537/m.57515 type:complete len:252 (-) Transcript_35537:121-876(-)